MLGMSALPPSAGKASAKNSGCWRKLPQAFYIGMFPLMLAVLNKDYDRGYYNAYSRTVRIKGNIPTTTQQVLSTHFPASLEALRSPPSLQTTS